MNAHDTRVLVRTGQHLTTLGLGCAGLGNLFTAVSDEAARATVDAAWEAGIRYFDTAPFYGFGLAEHRLGQALRTKPRHAYCVSSKVGRLLDPIDRSVSWAEPCVVEGWDQPLPFRPRFDYRAVGMRRSVEDSLQRMGLAHIDMALVHDIGFATHGDKHDYYWEQLTQGGGFRELETMRSEGLIGAIGLGVNEWPVILNALDYIDLDCSLLAGRYTLLEQGALRPLMDVVLARGVGIILGGPFNSGILVTGACKDAKFNYGDAPTDIIAKVKRLETVCQEFQVPLAAAALQFPLAHPAIVSCIPGARNVKELHDILGWLNIPIPPQFWANLRQAGLIAETAPIPMACH